MLLLLCYFNGQDINHCIMYIKEKVKVSALVIRLGVGQHMMFSEGS